MRTRIVLAGFLAGTAAALLPIAPASANCVDIVVDDCASLCAGWVYAEADRAAGDALPGLPLQVDCTA